MGSRHVTSDVILIDQYLFYTTRAFSSGLHAPTRACTSCLHPATRACTLTRTQPLIHLSTQVLTCVQTQSFLRKILEPRGIRLSMSSSQSKSFTLAQIKPILYTILIKNTFLYFFSILSFLVLP